MFDEWHSDIANFLEKLSATLLFELVELNIRRQGKVIYIEVLVDKETGGIRLDECSVVNKHLARYLEEKNLIAEDYIIEVSSPGLDRPLKTQKDFMRIKGQPVRFHLTDLVEGKKEYLGTVQEVDSFTVKVQTKKNTVVIPLEKIQKAVLMIE